MQKSLLQKTYIYFYNLFILFTRCFLKKQIKETNILSKMVNIGGLKVKFLEHRNFENIEILRTSKF